MLSTILRFHNNIVGYSDELKLVQGPRDEMRGFTGNFTKQADDHRRYSTALFSVLTDWKGTLQCHLHKISISAARAEKFACLRTNYSL